MKPPNHLNGPIQILDKNSGYHFPSNNIKSINELKNICWEKCDYIYYDAIASLINYNEEYLHNGNHLTIALYILYNGKSLIALFDNKTGLRI